MKRFTALILVLSMLLSLGACGSSTAKQEESEEEVIQEIIEELTEDADEEESEMEDIEEETPAYILISCDRYTMYVVGSAVVYAEPDAESDVLGILSDGKAVSVLGQCVGSSFVQIGYNASTGFVDSANLTTEKAVAITETESETTEETETADTTTASENTATETSSDSISDSGSGSSSSTSSSTTGSTTTGSSNNTTTGSSSSAESTASTTTTTEVTNYSCGVSWHGCGSEEQHERAVSQLESGCPHCGCHDLSCGYFYWNSYGTLCVNSSACSQYDITKDSTYYCQICGKKRGDGSGNTCVRYLADGHNCSACGEAVPASTCHTCN